MMIAATAVPLVCLLGYLIADLRESRHGTWQFIDVLLPTMMFFVIGWPLALLLGAPIAILVGADLQAGKRSARRTTIVSAVLIGAAGVPLVWSATDLPNSYWILAITGALAGLAAGSALCYFADERRRQR